MLGFLKDLIPQSPDPDPEQEVRSAAASLLLAMTRADSNVTDLERGAVKTALGKLLRLDPARTDDLLQEAERQVEESVSLHDFTRILHRQQTKEEKVHLVELLWEVACSDGEIDPQEELLVRKVSTLLYLSQAEFIAAKQAALDSYKSGRIEASS